MADPTENVEDQNLAHQRAMLFATGIFQRERRDTLESQASSLDFNDDTDELAHLPYGVDSRILEESETEFTDSDDTQPTSDTEVPGPLPLRRSTTFERVLSDAIIHHAPVDELKVILDAGSKILKPDVKKPNPLHYTVWQRYPEAAELVLQRGYDVNTIDDYGYSALHLAARHGYTDMVELLLAHGSIVNYNDYEALEGGRFPVDAKDEPLRLAVKYGHAEVVKLLLEHGADPNSRYFFGCEVNLVNPLRPDILNLLLHFGANVNEQDRNGLTPLMKACRLRQGMDSILLLLAYGADVNVRADARHDYRTALHYAVLSGSMDVVTVLLDSGALIRFEEDYDKPTPLHLAVRRGYVNIINLLLDTGADINGSTSLIGSVLHMACSEKIKNRLEVMELLLQRGADPNIIVLGLDGTPMLPPLGDYLAASDEHDNRVINLLLRYGAEVIMKSPQASPLGLLNCVSYLRQQPNLLEELLEGAQQFDLKLIKNTKLISNMERKVLVEVAESPLPLRHLTRICIRHDTNTSRPEAILNMKVPSMISRYLLYEIS